MEEEHTVGHYANAGEYIQHHLRNLQVCRHDGVWVWNECAGNFWTINVDSMFFSVVLGLVFLYVFRRVAKNATTGRPGNLQTDIDGSEAAMKLAERHLEDSSIRAPFDGYVQQRMVSLGELVKAPMPVMTVVRVDPLKLLSEIPERMAPWIKVGQPVTLRVDAFQDKTFTATVSRISTVVNTQTRTVALE